MSWLFTKSAEYGTVKSWKNNGTFCRALIRDDGKIISTIDCWDGYDPEVTTCRIDQRTDGKYLIEPMKRYEIKM